MAKVASTKAKAKAKATKKTKEKPEECVAYVRTSSLANARPDAHSEKRQKDTIGKYCEGAGLRIAKFFSDPGVSGTDHVHDRPGFSSMMEFARGRDVKTIVFEDASRFSRHLYVQELAFQRLTELGFKLVSAASPGQFSSEGSGGDVDPTVALVRQILGAVVQFERSAMVQRLKVARENAAKKTAKRTLDGRPKVTGRESALKGPCGQRLQRVLAPFLGAVAAQERGALTSAQLACTKAGLKTKKGKACSLSQVRFWCGVLSADQKGRGRP